MQRAPLLAAILVLAPLAMSAQRADVRAPMPSSISIGDMPETAKEVEIKTKDKLALRAAFFEPKKSKQLAPGSILVHDSGDRGDTLYGLAERMQRNGFAVLVVDLRGHGRSAGKSLDWTKLNEDDKKAAWALAVRDLEAASDWLQDQRSVHTTNLTVAGHRAGCGLAARYALRDENVRSVVLIEPNAEEVGVDLTDDLTELGGLPTYIVSRKETAKTTEAMIAEAHQAAGGNPYIELMICSAKQKDETPAIERKAVSGIAKWTKERAFPKK